jgi:hypothetical protein
MITVLPSDAPRQPGEREPSLMNGSYTGHSE